MASLDEADVTFWSIIFNLVGTILVGVFFTVAWNYLLVPDQKLSYAAVIIATVLAHVPGWVFRFIVYLTA